MCDKCRDAAGEYVMGGIAKNHPELQAMLEKMAKESRAADHSMLVRVTISYRSEGVEVERSGSAKMMVPGTALNLMDSDILLGVAYAKAKAAFKNQPEPSAPEAEANR